jgi:hypothetical protein
MEESRIILERTHLRGETRRGQQRTEHPLKTWPTRAPAFTYDIQLGYC